ncbi:tyrosine-type recombinase/integrase [Sporosarcina sp. GW1-11]|uniref:tyrosine-type recombinase/integrase n=1 Tax=Sporosarcina sp. GW1-11 TaxID=2899126 RepID=UPI00294BB107|nr:tyrosine-type recombinase/integrase [Sporosarcina sp. GW1-11]MDV6378219.1 tyrosine-type recombinase/integrase [Sporosarcina sp. GW1-11]
MLFDDAMALFLRSIRLKEFSGETQRAYARDLKLFNTFLSEEYNAAVYIDEITVHDIEQYLHYLAVDKVLKARSRNRYVSTVSSMFNYALKKEWIEKNPATFIDTARVTEQKKVSLTEGEIAQLVEVIEKPILRLAVLFMAKTGLRVNEVVMLKLSEVDLETNIVHVIEGKGGKYREVPIAESLRTELIEYLQQTREADSEYFFATKKTGRLSAQYINRELKMAAEALGWDKNITNHTLRRSFATILLNKNVNIVTIQHLLGHASLRTTSIYLNILDLDLRNAVDLLD